MNILVTGAKGFVGKNLCISLKNIKDGKDKTRSIDIDEIFECDIDTTDEELLNFTAKCDFVFHLAGINRPKEEKEFMEGNFEFADKVLKLLSVNKKCCPIMLSSSIQASLDNAYGISKRAGEDAVFKYGKKNKTDVYVYRFPNIFGKWSRPNYNSAVATFCNNIARDLPITINDPEVLLNLIYVDDVVASLVDILENKVRPSEDGFCYASPVYQVKLGKVAELIYGFKNMRENLGVPCVSDEFENKLYATYLSFLPEDKFSYPLKMNVDNRGSFTEILRTASCGQFSVNISKPGITKGNHWHHTKNEKFVVVYGRGVIRFRNPDSKEITEYFVNGDDIRVVDIPTGYTHNIENLGDTDMVTFMWCNECFNPEKPDTFFLEV